MSSNGGEGGEGSLISEEVVRRLKYFDKNERWNDGILYLQSCKITDEMLEEIILKWLIKKKLFDKIKTLNLERNKITSKGASLLFKKKLIDKIKELDLERNKITSKGASMLFNKLKECNSSIEIIDLSDNELDDDCMKSLGEFIQNSHTIEDIDIGHNKITNNGALVLFTTLKECKSSIERINLYKNELDDNCIESLGEFIQNNQTIEYINIGKNKITDKGTEILLPYLISNITIKRFDIYGNKGITDKSIPLLNEIIQKSNIEVINIIETSITNHNILVVPLTGNKLKNGYDKIYIDGNGINDEEDIIEICNFIKKYGCNKLKVINFHNNKITSKGSSLLFNTLREYKSSVEAINLFNNKLDDDCMESLGEFIQNNQTIKNINIGKNNITDKGIEILLPHLIGNITINKIDISWNEGITDKSVPLLKEIIQQSNIENININFGTSITEEGYKEIELALSIPIDERETPLITIGNVKSASKRMKEE